MNKTNKTQGGFGGLIVVAVLAVILIVGAIGLMVAGKKTNSDSGASGGTGTSGASSGDEAMPSYAATDDYVNVIQKDGNSVLQLTPAKAAQTASQARILQTLHETCAGKADGNVTISSVTFQKQENFRLMGNFAFINASACDPVYKSMNAVQGSGKSTYLHKDASGKWIVDEMTQMGVACAKVEGKGYPFEIVQSCVNPDGSLKALQ